MLKRFPANMVKEFFLNSDRKPFTLKEMCADILVACRLGRVYDVGGERDVINGDSTR